MRRISIATALLLAACSAPPVANPRGSATPSARPSPSPSRSLAGNVYAATLTTTLNGAVAGITPRVYVPNAVSNTVDVIDPATFQIVGHFATGTEPQHITPSWDLKTLYVDEVYAHPEGALLPIDPVTGKPGTAFPIRDPYNLYFTPDGSKAIVVAERYNSLDFRDPATWKLLKSVRIPFSGVDHMDFTADGRYLFASTEYAGVVVKVDTVAMKVAGTVAVGGLPVDVKLSPDGAVMFVANQGTRSGVSVIDPVAMKVLKFIKTSAGAHGFALSRDGSVFYLSNRLAGNISVLDWRKRAIAKVWKVGGSPDMLQVSTDGTQLWFSNRFDGYVTVLDTATGTVLKKIKTATQPHGLCYFPQPGAHSLGHNGVYR
jgi:YVTN family beta-propeller protein